MKACFGLLRILNFNLSSEICKTNVLERLKSKKCHQYFHTSYILFNVSILCNIITIYLGINIAILCKEKEYSRKKKKRK